MPTLGQILRVFIVLCLYKAVLLRIHSDVAFARICSISTPLSANISMEYKICGIHKQSVDYLFYKFRTVPEHLIRQHLKIASKTTFNNVLILIKAIAVKFKE
jgi:hypothetical protein